jgi:2-keto-4-pentenoate hydratase/2-oxohepta-3-ene-1,7-dioic acid hydratase in catechol pathway
MELPVRGSEERVPANNIICLARTYAKHAQELGHSTPREPVVFLKPNSALVGHGADIVIPTTSNNVHHEIELALVLGEGGRHIPPERARDCILGYAIFLDITARDIQSRLKEQGLPWTLGKGWDTFAPISEITPAAAVEDPQQLELELAVSGEIRQKANTRDMVFSVEEIVAFVSRFMTLRRGDIIATGTPEGVGRLHPGDTTWATIEGLGELRNQVARAER